MTTAMKRLSTTKVPSMTKLTKKTHAQRMGFHRGFHDLDPAFERDELEEREQRRTERAPVLRVDFGEEVKAAHRVDVEDEAHQQDHVAHARDRAHERRDDETELRHGRNEPQHAQDANEPRDERELAGGGNQREHDDGEIEEIPAVAEVQAGSAARPR